MEPHTRDLIMGLADDPRWNKYRDYIDLMISRRLEIISTMLLSSEKDVAKHNHIAGEVAALREVKDMPLSLVVSARRNLRVVGE